MEMLETQMPAGAAMARTGVRISCARASVRAWTYPASDAGFEVQTQTRGAHLAALEGTPTRVVGLRPDFLIVQRGRACAIADTKRKRLEVTAAATSSRAGTTCTRCMGTQRRSAASSWQ